MNSMKRVVLSGVLLVVTSASAGLINLEWRPMYQSCYVGDVVGVGLYAVSDTGQDEPFNSAQVITTWDTNYVHLDGVNQAGAVLQPPDSSLYVPGDSFGLNESDPPTDGDGIWFGFVTFGQNRYATPAGSLLTTLMFTALAETPGTPVTMHATLQKPGHPAGLTKVIQQTYNVVGTLSEPAIIEIIPEPMALVLLALGGFLAWRR